MPAEAGPEPLGTDFLDQLEGHDELLVSSRDTAGQGTVRMWFAVVPPGFVYLLTQPYSLKAERWREDPWVRLRIPGSEVSWEGVVTEVGWEAVEADAQLLTARFGMAGAATPEALQWMLQDRSRQLYRVERPPAGSDRAGSI